MISSLSPNIWKLNVDSNVYLVMVKEPFVIDTGPRFYLKTVKKELSKKIDLEKIKKVVLTHFHHDHIGNFDLFPNATFYASKEEIEDFKKAPMAATGLDPVTLERFKALEFQELKDFDGFKVIPAPGHSRGSVVLWYEKEKILFSGDTIFNNGYGRIDLPTSVPEKMDGTLEMVMGIPYKILAPGHDY